MGAVRAEAKRSGWGFVSAAWYAGGILGGFSTISSPGVGGWFTSTAHSPALAGPLEGLGPQGRGVLRWR